MTEKPETKTPQNRSYWLRSLGRLLFFNPLDTVASMLPIKKRGETGRRRVVFARLDSIGDFVIWTAAFPVFEKIYPSAEFERMLIANSGWAKLAESTGFFDEVIAVNRKRFVTSPAYRFKTLRRVRSLNADIFINPTHSRDLLWVDCLARISGAAERIGSSGISSRMTAAQKRITDSWYSKLIGPPAEIEHELISNHRFANAVAEGEIETPPNLPELPFAVGKGSAKKRTAVLFPGAQYSYRRWPVKNFAAAANFLAKERGLEIILCGGPGEEHLADEFAEHFNGKFQDLTGKTTLAEMAEILSSAQVLLANDTGAGHIAAAVGCPAVIIISGAQSGRFFPYPKALAEQGLRQIGVTYEMPCFGCDWHCIYSEIPKNEPRPCITNIAVENVRHALGEILDAK